MSKNAQKRDFRARTKFALIPPRMSGLSPLFVVLSKSAIHPICPNLAKNTLPSNTGFREAIGPQCYFNDNTHRERRKAQQKGELDLKS
jgi:hypothetical protein